MSIINMILKEGYDLFLNKQFLKMAQNWCKAITIQKYIFLRS